MKTSINEMKKETISLSIELSIEELHIISDSIDVQLDTLQESYQQETFDDVDTKEFYEEQIKRTEHILSEILKIHRKHYKEFK